jgi:uncharacterized repeat protein (TIGR03803 family)
MRLLKALTLTACILTPCLVAPRAHAQAISTLTVLHNFGFTNAGVEYPDAPVVQGPDGTLYGTTYAGVANVFGCVFKVSTNGTDYTVLKYFTNSVTDGQNPLSGLVLSGNTLYGTTRNGGPGQAGAVFAINTDGTGFTNLYIFGSLQSAADGFRPQGNLVLSGSTLYGTTTGGGSSGNGTVFKINTNGTGFTNFYNFTGGNDGVAPQAGLVLSGGRLYGTTPGSGSGGSGTVFAVNTDGTGFAILYSFSPLVNNTNSDGANSQAPLVLSGGTLYGTAQNGGTGGDGTIFAVNTNGTGFTNFYSFTSTLKNPLIGFPGLTNSDGATPTAGLILAGNTLFGMTSSGGINSYGTIFSITTNGTGFNVCHTFGSIGGDGAAQGNGLAPGNSFIVSGSTLYGTTPGGGSVGYGTVFEMNTNGTGYSIIYNLGPINVGDPQSELVLSGNTLFGTTRYGGTNNVGTIYAVNTDGTGFTILHSFTGGDDGDTPESRLVLSGSTLYGTTAGGGVNRGGTVFSINTSGMNFTPLYSFTGGNDGGNPNTGGLILSGGVLYGTTVGGGTNNNGTVFKINTGNSSFTSLYSFSATAYCPQENSYTNSDGANPSSGLVLSGGTLYGTANGGGVNGVGTVFAINTGGTGFTNLHSFSQVINSTNSDGAGPAAGLVLAGGRLYGSANGGGSYGSGTLFSLNINGTGFTLLHTFTDGPLGDGGNPSEDMILFGTTLIGDDGAGDVFAINTNGTDYLILYSLNGTTDGAQAGGPDGGPQSGGLVLASGTLYGTAEAQGAGGYGTVFALKPLPTPLNIQPGNNSVVLSWLNPLLSLQSTPVVTGTFTNMPAAYSPYTNTITAPQQFFRLIAN